MFICNSLFRFLFLCTKIYFVAFKNYENLLNFNDSHSIFVVQKNHIYTYLYIKFLFFVNFHIMRNIKERKYICIDSHKQSLMELNNNNHDDDDNNMYLYKKT